MPGTEHSAPQPDFSCPADVTRLIRSKLVPVEATLDELRNLFTGVPADSPCDLHAHGDDPWATSPTYTVTLAFEIAKRANVTGEFDLRRLLYGSLVADEVPAAAREVIALAAQRYRTWRDLQNRRTLGTAA